MAKKSSTAPTTPPVTTTQTETDSGADAGLASAGAAGAPTAPKKVPPTAPAANLNFDDRQTIITHLFILDPAEVVKNFAWKVSEQDLHSITHQHSYRTMTSQGEFMQECSPILAHFHKCELMLDENGNPILDTDGHLQIKVGPSQTTSGGKTIDWPHDSHTHTARYIRSNKIEVQSVSADVVQKIQRMDPFMRIGLSSTAFPQGSKGI